jgi:thiamine-monophosphate kinase
VIPSPDPDFDGLLTSDAVVEDLHFEAGVHPEQVGRKAVSRTLSDIAAMGGEPQYLLLNIGAPSTFSVSSLESIMRAARDRAAEFGAVIAGGDLTRMDRLEIHVFCQGRVPAGQALLRSGAQVGDGLYVTGCLGGSLQGRHLEFRPRIREALWLREHVGPTAMMDLSDGLAADLPRLAAESGVGAQVNLADLPVSADVPDRDPASALMDGEDYELLFSVPRDRAADWTLAFEKEFGISVCRMGEILPAGNGLVIVAQDGMDRDWPEGGYKHF